MSSHIRKHEQAEVDACNVKEEFDGCLPEVRFNNEFKHDNFDIGIEEGTSDIAIEVSDNSEYSSSSIRSSRSDTIVGYYDGSIFEFEENHLGYCVCNTN